MLKTVSSVTNAIGALNYKGTWNASTNTPTLTSGVGTKGDYYVVSTAGSTDLDGTTLWGVGDWAVFNGSIWQKVDGGDTTTVTTLTVTGLTGYMYANNTSPVTASTTIPNAGLANSTITLGNATLTLGSTTSTVGNLTLTNTTANGVSLAYVAKTSGYTATSTDYTIAGNASTAAFSVTLPTSVGITGKVYVVKKVDSSANAVTVATTSSQTIDGATTKALSTQYDAITVQSDGANWIIIANTFGRNGAAGSF